MLPSTSYSPLKLFMRPWLRFPLSVSSDASAILEPTRILLNLLQFSIDHESLKITGQTHARLWLLGFVQDVFLATKLVTAYSICGVPTDSRLVFNTIHQKNVFLWNSMISGYVKNNFFEEPMYLFDEMDVEPDNFTFASVLKICGELGNLNRGKGIHFRVIRSGFYSDVVVKNSLVGMYCKCRSLSDARKVFDEMSQRNIASMNAMISGYANLGGYVCEIWKLMSQMQREGLKPDAVTVVNLLPLCANFGDSSLGREVHCYVFRNELESDLHVGSCLVTMYSKCGSLNSARHVFERIPCRNVFSWTSMIAAYVENGDGEEALKLFGQMQVVGNIIPNRVSLVSVLPACSYLAGLIEGKQIHCFSVRTLLNSEISVNNALLDMYSKCGKLDYARRVFNNSSNKDVISWSSMIAGYGLHGKAEEALVLFREMQRLEIKPDQITFVGILSACGRRGLIDEGFELYNSMIVNHGISPTVEICSCMVDMLGRAGQLDRALSFVDSMPVNPSPSIWGALFNASILHRDSDMGRLASGFLLQLEPENPSNYVSLSNVYAASGRWDGVAEMRKEMKERGLQKLPGCSWITVNNKIHSFYVADKSHPNSNLIYTLLDSLILIMKGVEYVSNTENMLQDAS